MGSSGTGKGRRKGAKSNLVLVFIFAIGLLVLLYPTISNYVNQLHASRVIVGYDDAVRGMSAEQKQELLAQAQAFNQKLASGSQTFTNGASKDEYYNSLLNVTGDGMMGYVTIKKLGVNLPIYHGTSDDILRFATGHLQGTSLPIGGSSTHSVITGHRGLPAAKLFTDLDRMEVGDTFTVTVLDQTIAYEVDQIKIVLPEETTDLQIEPGKDYVTLLTCTPYAVNTHRLLVRGRRVALTDVDHVPADALQISPTLVAGVLAIPLIIILLILVMTGGKRRRNRARR